LIPDFRFHLPGLFLVGAVLNAMPLCGSATASEPEVRGLTECTK